MNDRILVEELRQSIHRMVFGELQKRKMKPIRCGLILAIVMMMTGPAIGQVSSWLNTQGGFYETPQNWSAQQVPPPENSVIFGFQGGYDVAFQDHQTSAGLTVTIEASPTFKIGGNQSTDRSYTINGDVLINDEGRLILQSGTSNGRFHLNVEDHEVHVDGFEFNTNNGLEIRNDAMLTSNFGIIGFDPGTYGRVLITGDQSEWIAANSYVGYAGVGELNIGAGGSLASTFRTIVAEDSTSAAIINVQGIGSDGLPSMWITEGEFNQSTELGSHGAAVLSIIDGAFASHEQIDIARYEDSQATVLVRGEDTFGNPTTWFTGDMTTSQFGGQTEMTFDEGAMVFSEYAFVGGKRTRRSSGSWNRKQRESNPMDDCPAVVCWSRVFCQTLDPRWCSRFNGICESGYKR